jgi:hypothetical protein
MIEFLIGWCLLDVVLLAFWYVLLAPRRAERQGLGSCQVQLANTKACLNVGMVSAEEIEPSTY